jgi:hypothetical protein
MMTWLAVGGGVAAGFVVLLVVDSPRRALACLIGVTGVLMQAQVGGVHAFTIVTVGWLVLAGRREGTARALRAAVLVACAALLASTAVFGDLVNSRTLALQLLALSLTAGALMVWASPDDVRLVLSSALLTITAGASVGLLQVVHVVPITQDLWSAGISEIGRPLGIWPEPDWLGLFSALGLVLAWRLRLSPLVRTVALGINGLSLLLSFARAAWVAVVASIVIGALVRWATSHRPDRPRGRVGPLVVVVVVAGAVVAATPALASDLGRRLDSLTSTQSDDVSARARVQQTEGLLTLARTAGPWGHGLSASGRVGVSGKLYLSGTSPNNVASNWVLGLWVDGALLAVPLTIFLGVTALRGASWLPGQMLVVVLVSSLWSNALFQPVAWLCLALTLWEWPARGAPPVVRGPGVGLPEVARTAAHLRTSSSGRH